LLKRPLKRIIPVKEDKIGWKGALREEAIKGAERIVKERLNKRIAIKEGKMLPRRS
jgi:hypothetical protein